MDAEERHSSATARPSVYWLSAHAGSYGGAATSMVKAIDRRCRERGWRLECCYTSVVRDRPWLADLSDAGIAFDIAPDGRRAKAEWLGRKLDGLDAPAVLNTHFAAYDLAALAAGRGRAATTIWHVHSILPGGPAHRVRSVVKYRWLSRRVSRIVCVSESAAKSVIGHGANRERITVVENGIDLNRFTPTTTEQRREARAALGIEGDDPVLLHFGWDWQVKGGELYMGALARLRAEGVPAKGLVVGGGEEFRDAARRLGFPPDSLLTVAPSENVRPFYDAADLLLATSPAEGGGPPLAVVEALSCGTPVVATDIEGHRPGGVAPPALHLVAAEPEPLAAAAGQALAAPPDERREAAAATRQWVERERNIEVWAERMAAIYGEALAGL